MRQQIRSGGVSPARVSTEKVINQFLNSLPKVNSILDVGSKKQRYEGLLGSSTYCCVDITPSPNVDFVCDAHDLPFADNSFDLVLLIEVLEHLENPQKALDEIYRVLRSDGNLILSTRFIFPYHGDPKDFFRFTPEGLSTLMKGFDETTISPAGNVLVSLSMIFLHLLPEPLRKHRLFSWIGYLPTSSRTRFACGYVVKARK